MENFSERFENFMNGATAMRQGYCTKMGYEKFYNPVLVSMDGKRYIRVVTQNIENNNESVFCFIDKTNGDVLKAAGWKAPAKGARGNIFDDHNGLSRVTAYGTEYNK